MLKNADFVRETTTTTGTGTYALAGAPTGKRTFVAGVGSGNYCKYIVENGTDFETGLGLVTSGSPDTLARTAVISSSNSNNAVNWGAGTKNVYCGQIGRDANVIRVGASSLGSAGASIALTVPIGLTKLWGHAFIKAPGAVVPRLLLGGAALDTAANYAASNALPNTAAVASASLVGWNLIVAAMANTNQTLVTFNIVKAAAGFPARGTWLGSNISVATATAPTLHQGGGMWNNTTDLIAALELRGYSALTGTTAANMDTGSELVVYGSYED